MSNISPAPNTDGFPSISRVPNINFFPNSGQISSINRVPNNDQFSKLTRPPNTGRDPYISLIIVKEVKPLIIRILHEPQGLA